MLLADRQLFHAVFGLLMFMWMFGVDSTLFCIMLVLAMCTLAFSSRGYSRLPKQLLPRAITVTVDDR